MYQNDFSSSFSGFTTTSAVLDSTGPGGSQAAHITDSSTSAGGLSSILAFNNAAVASFNTSPGQTLVISADFAVTSLFADPVNSNSIPRLRLQSPSAASSDLFVGFGQNSANKLVLFAARGDNPQPGTNPVLFNFGDYDTATGSNNDTNGFWNITITYVDQATTAKVTATQGATSVSVDLNGFAPVSFSHSSTQTFGMITGQSSTTSIYLDNVNIQVVPEPSVVALGMVSSVGLLALRRRR